MRPETDRREPTFIERARRAQIIAATERTVARLGYAQTSLAKIAVEGGFSKSVISYHFASKNELMRQVAEAFFDEVWQAMLGRLEAEETHSRQVQAWVEVQVEQFVAQRTRALAAVDILSNLRDDDGRLLYPDYAEEEIDDLTAILRAGQETGEFRAFDARAYATVIINLTEALLGPWLMDPTTDTDIGPRTAAALDFIHHALSEGTP